MKKPIFLLALFMLSNLTIIHSQIMNSNGALISILPGALIHSNGGVSLNASTELNNDGTLQVTKNSNLLLPGTFSIRSNSVVSGNGLYSIEQDWVNDATFNAENSEVRLVGNTEQFITSNNTTITEFNDLVLTGSGTGVDRRKSLVNVGARISANGQLNLTNRELYGGVNNLVVLNPVNSAIVNSTSMNAEGFISHLEPATILWNTNSTNSYIFPVGSSDGTLRYRPVIIYPISATNSTYSVRMNNYSADLDNYNTSQKEVSIESVNNAFYHSIDRVVGESTANISIAYLPSADGEFTGIANWNIFESIWKDIENSDESPFGNYSSMTKENWIFNDEGDPYVLTNSGEFLEVPNVFTPNGDGVNDFYFINSKGMEELELTIVNRWGEVVFTSNDINGTWDGTSNGNLCSDGVYFYILKAKSKTQDYQKQGHVTLNAN